MSKLLYWKPAGEWIEALPLGNGSIGAMVYGGVDKETICLNHDTLWSGIPKQYKKEGAYEAYLETRRLVLEGQYEEAHKVNTEGFLGINCEVYLPFGNMHIEFDAENDVKDYRRCLDLSRGVLTVDYSCSDIAYKREYFVSFPDDVMVIKITADKAGKVNFKLHMDSPLRNVVHSVTDIYVLDGECPGNSHADDFYSENEYEYSDIPEKKGVLFRGGVKVLNQGGEVFYSDDGIVVKNADSAVVLLAIKTSFNGYNKLPAVDGKEYKDAVLNTVWTAQNLGWEKLLARHLTDYKSLFERIRLDLGESGYESMPTDERLKRFGEGQDDVSLYTLMFDFGRYLTISASRENSQAMNLQGIWNASMTPPWRCNYTNNINLEMNYWPTLMCGLENCFEPLIRYVQDRSEAGEHTAQQFYHARGFAIHHNSDIWAHTTPVFNNARWGFWHGGGGWLCHSLFSYYEYTQDKEYLKNIAYPVMKKAAQFYLDILCDRGDGMLAVCPATSPENYFLCENGAKSAVAKFTAMSDTIAYELFRNCFYAIKEIEVDDVEFEKEITEAVGKMQPIRVGSDGGILEWNEEFEEESPQHRHVSHLYALYPANLITPSKSPELAEGCRKTLEKRGDDGTGWSLAWKINLYAKLGDGNHALSLLDRQLRYVTKTQVDIVGGGTYPNLFCAHPPFQIDGNFGLVSGILGMLADVRDEEVCLLPALPDKWKNGKLTGLRIRGGRILDVEWKDGKVLSYKLRNGNG